MTEYPTLEPSLLQGVMMWTGALGYRGTPQVRRWTTSNETRTCLITGTEGSIQDAILHSFLVSIPHRATVSLP